MPRRSPIALLGGRGNLLRAFAAMISSFGGTFKLADHRDPNPKREHSEGRFTPHARPLSMRGYYFDSHGSLRRRTPKRDKSMSARQWRKQRRLQRAAQGGAA